MYRGAYGCRYMYCGIHAARSAVDRRIAKPTVVGESQVLTSPAAFGNAVIAVFLNLVQDSHCPMSSGITLGVSSHFFF